MPSRKRSLEDAEDGTAPDNSLLTRIRGMWQFANFSQWVFTFGKAAKIDESIDVEDIEMECLKPSSTLLADMALAILKLISSHRGLTHDIFDSQARKQYLDKAPERNPFGDDETPLRFHDFDVFTKIRVLQQFTQWTMIHPERIREKMEEQKDSEQAEWRIEPYGWDSEDRTYFVLDDNRVYRLTDAPPAPPKPKKKKNTKAFRAGRRASKRRKVEVEAEDDADTTLDAQEDDATVPLEDGLGGMKWECLAVTLDEVRQLLDSFRKTRDENEKILRRQLEDHLLPILEKQEESRRRKIQQRERELLSLAKMANAKRSSRLANKIEQQKQEEQARDELQHQRQLEAAQRREEQAQIKREKERDNRMASRGQRLKEREARRIQHEEELAQLSEDSRRLDDGSGRGSERRLQAEIEKNKQALREIEDEDEDWIFDCTCGLYGQVDDGSHSVACEECNVWQHSKCLGISESEAERSDFHFICGDCQKRKREAENRPKTTIRLKVNRPSSSQSQQSHGIEQSPASQTKSKTIVEIPSQAPDEHKPPTAPQTAISFGQASSPLPPNSIIQDAPALPPVSRAPGMAQASHDHPSEHHPQLANGWKHEQAKDAHGWSPEKPTVSTQETKPLLSNASQEQSPMPAPDASVMRTPSSSFGQLQDQHPVSESALSTPAINRDIYRAAHLQNGNIPAQGGHSPTKHSPQSSFASLGANSNGATPAKIPAGITLSPSPQEPILTPPTKHQEPPFPTAHQ